MKTVLLGAVLLATNLAGVALGNNPPSHPGFPPSPADLIDRAVLWQLKRLGIQAAGECSDPVFLRRVFLDVIGTIPTPAEAKAFLEDKRPGKRGMLIDSLLTRPEFATYWAMKWSDLLRVKSEFPINLWPNAAQAYYQWIRASIRANMPYDRFMRELVTANGSNFRVAPVNFYRALLSKKPETLAGAVALTFMGARMEKWSPERQAGLTAFFRYVGFKPTAEWKEEIIYFDMVKVAKALASRKVVMPRFPDGGSHRLTALKDPRVAFADWLCKPDNPWFATNIVNRIWFWLQGRGIIQPPDDIRPDNPPVNADLLSLLARELVAAKYDLRHIYRIILKSKTYQSSYVPRDRKPLAEANFAHYSVRRLDAEVLIDAICQITGTTEKYSSMIPEPFTFIPAKQRSIRLPDGSITSPFLEMFGRPPRDTGLEGERNNKPTAAQRLHLLNSSHIRRKIEQGGKVRAISRAGRGNPRRTMELLYLAILSRNPTMAEWRILNGHLQGKRWMGWSAVIDLAWALMNTAEFQYRH